jgi:hypothetical protein
MMKMTKQTRVVIGISIFAVFAIDDFWRGYHQSRSIPLGVITAIGGIVGGLLVLLLMWPGSPDNRPDKHDSSGTLV